MLFLNKNITAFATRQHTQKERERESERERERGRIFPYHAYTHFLLRSKSTLALRALRAAVVVCLLLVKSQLS